MAFGGVPELNLLGLADAGVPNAERIALQAVQRVFTADYLLLVGVAYGNGILPTVTFYLGDTPLEILPGEILVVYTGPGSYQKDVAQNGQVTHFMYLRQQQTLFWAGTAFLLVRIAGISQRVVAVPTPTPAKA